MLVDAGYIVLGAADADEAIRILEERDDITAMFTDVNMPGSMDGLKLVETVRKRWPPVLLIVTSGKAVLGDGDLPLRSCFVPKPYSNDQLLSALTSLAA